MLIGQESKVKNMAMITTRYVLCAESFYGSAFQRYMWKKIPIESTLNYLVQVS